MPDDVLQVQCSSCLATFKVNLLHAGKRGKCPKCGSIFLVPQAQPPTIGSRDSNDESALGELASAAAKNGNHPTTAPASQKKRIWRLVFVAISVLLPAPITLLVLNKIASDRSEVVVREVTQRPSPTISVPFEVAADDRQIDLQIAASRARVPQQIMAHRKAMEALCDELDRAALREPDYLHAAGYAKTVQQMALSIAQQRGSISPNMLLDYRSYFARTESQSVIDRMIAEAKRTLALIRDQNQELEALEARRPSHITEEKKRLVADQEEQRRRIAANDADKKWVAVATEVDVTQSEAKAFIRNAGISKARVVTSRAEATQLLDELEKRSAGHRATAESLRQRLRKHQQDLRTFSESMEAFPVIVKETQEWSANLDKIVNGLEEIKPRDLSAALAYHRRFLVALPNPVSNFASLNAFGIAVLKGKAQDSAQWAVPSIPEMYSQWQNAAFDRLLQGDLEHRLRSALAAHDEGLKSFTDDGSWHRTAMALSVQELEQLSLFLTKAVLDPNHIVDRERLTQMAEDASDERKMPPTEKHAGLVPVSAVLQARKTGLLDPTGRAHHRATFQHWNERGTLSDIGTMKEFITNDARAFPAYWNEVVESAYSNYQSAQWQSFSAASAKEAGERKTPPALAAITPTAPAQNAALGDDGRAYHAVLIQRLNANKTLADVVAVKKLVEAETKAHPEQWKDEGLLSLYGDLQTDQWLAFYEGNLKKNAEAMTNAYFAKSADPAAWGRAAHAWKPYARDMLALLKGGRVNETAFWTRVTTSGKAVGLATPTLVDPAFWDAVLKGR